MVPQATGFGYAQPQQPMQTGINSMLPPALQPQQTGMNGYGNPSYNQPPPVPPIPQQPTATPLSPQKTGPPPSVRFGVKPDAPKKLAPQPTGLRANLSQASKCTHYFQSKEANTNLHNLISAPQPLRFLILSMYLGTLGWHIWPRLLWQLAPLPLSVAEVFMSARFAGAGALHTSACQFRKCILDIDIAYISWLSASPV